MFDVDGCAIPVIWRAPLIKNKRAARRSQDIADVEALEREQAGLPGAKR
jgi:hypothetical protein